MGDYRSVSGFWTASTKAVAAQHRLACTTNCFWECSCHGAYTLSGRRKPGNCLSMDVSSFSPPARMRVMSRFLSSCNHKLGLHGLPHAVACAKYHVLSNGVGGVAVEVYAPSRIPRLGCRFRYPRWMYAGLSMWMFAISPPARSYLSSFTKLGYMAWVASRGFLHGWYAQNGYSGGGQSRFFATRDWLLFASLRT